MPGLLPASLRTGIRFLTVLPVPLRGEPHTAGAGAWFPLVGLLIGIPLYAAMLLPLAPLPRAAVVLALWIVMTGGLHEDGWMDCMDAAFAPVSRERRLAILKDPHIGAHGVTGGVLLLLLRFGALTVVPPVATLAAPLIGRWAMALSVALAPPARTDGLGAEWARSARPVAATLCAAALLSAIAAAALFAAPEAAPPSTALPARIAGSWALGGLAAVACGSLLARRFGGLTGDGHGAVGLTAELAAVWAFLPMKLAGA